MLQRQLVIKAFVTQLDIEDLVRTKYTITHFHFITLMWVSVNVTIYGTVLIQRYQDISHFIMLTTKLLRRCI
jgi:hypothetical protein